MDICNCLECVELGRDAHRHEQSGDSRKEAEAE
jgi:hypothetical protein